MSDELSRKSRKSMGVIQCSQGYICNVGGGGRVLQAVSSRRGCWVWLVRGPISELGWCSVSGRNCGSSHRVLPLLSTCQLGLVSFFSF